MAIQCGACGNERASEATVLYQSRPICHRCCLRALRAVSSGIWLGVFLFVAGMTPYVSQRLTFGRWTSSTATLRPELAKMIEQNAFTGVCVLIFALLLDLIPIIGMSVIAYWAVRRWRLYRAIGSSIEKVLAQKPRRVAVTCPGCGKHLKGATSDMVGDVGVCPTCKAEFEIEGWDSTGPPQ